MEVTTTTTTTKKKTIALNLHKKLKPNIQWVDIKKMCDRRLGPTYFRRYVWTPDPDIIIIIFICLTKKTETMFKLCIPCKSCKNNHPANYKTANIWLWYTIIFHVTYEHDEKLDVRFSLYWNYIVNNGLRNWDHNIKYIIIT